MRRRWRGCAKQGAVLLGKTTTPEFGWKGVTDARSPASRAIPGTREDARRLVGRPAAAARGRHAPLTLGTDGGGSIRIPAGFTGIFGLKPSFGRVPAWPLVALRHGRACRADDAHASPMRR